MQIAPAFVSINLTHCEALDLLAIMAEAGIAPDEPLYPTYKAIDEALSEAMGYDVPLSSPLAQEEEEEPQPQERKRKKAWGGVEIDCFPLATATANLKHSQLNMLGYFWKYWSTSKCINPSIREIAELSGLSMNRVRNIIKALVEGGWLLKEERYHPIDKARLSNQYRLVLDPETGALWEPEPSNKEEPSDG